MNRLWLVSVTALLIGVATRECAADIISFNFTQPGGATNFAPGHNFTASGTTHTSPTLTGTPVVNLIGNGFMQQTSAGLGIGHPLDLIGSPSQIDNLGFAETLNLQLSDLGGYTDIKLKSITFGGIEHFDLPSPIAWLNEVFGDDDIQLLSPTGITFDPAPDANGLFKLIFNSPIALSLNDLISLKAPGTIGNDDFTLVGIELEATAAEVPEPASVALWLLATATGAVVARRKLRQQRQNA